MPYIWYSVVREVIELSYEPPEYEPAKLQHLGFQKWEKNKAINYRGALSSP